MVDSEVGYLNYLLPLQFLSRWNEQLIAGCTLKV
jgi:hypothetical protein